MQLSLERQVALGFALALAVLLLTGAGAVWSIARFESAFGWVDHTHRVRTSLEHVLVQALNVQTGSRGYALSGDAQFLRPFERGLAEIRTKLTETRRLLADSAAQQARLDELERQIDALVSVMMRRNELRRTGALVAPLSDELLETGKRAMDTIRELIEEMTAHETALLEQRTAAARRSAALTRLVLLLALAGTLALAAYAGTRVQREFAARQEADRALQRSRVLFENLFEHATDALVLIDRSGTIRRVSRRTEELFGHPRETLVGRQLETLMPERFRARHQAHRTGYAAAPKFRAMGAGLELHGLRADGTEFPVDIMLSPLELDDGPAVLAAVRDITERQAAAAALRRSADEIRDLYNHAPCGYHSLDERGTIIAINDTELEWLGYTRDEVLGRKRFTELLAPADTAVFEENFPRFKAAGRIDNLEFHLRRKDGSTFSVSLSATAIYDERGRYLQSRSTLHDITARRAAEQHLARLHAELQRHTAELEAANRELEAFSYSASHDLRAPLRHMAGFASLLGELPAVQAEPEARRYLGIITGSATKMGQLIDDLLAFSRLGRTALTPTLIDSTALVRGLIQDNLFDARPDTRWHIAPLPPVHGDRALLTQVWLNLLGNAVKYSRPSAPPEIQIDGRAAGREILFTVRDNGVGFDPRYADKLFRVFSRLHTDSAFSGTGVGLALVQRIIARHGGRVGADSTPGQGATFSFTLPMPDPALPDANRPPTHPPR